jgi:hypothetical protein
LASITVFTRAMVESSNADAIIRASLRIRRASPRQCLVRCDSRRCSSAPGASGGHRCHCRFRVDAGDRGNAGGP